MQITEFREFEPSVFATVREILLDSRPNPSKPGSDVQTILHALIENKLPANPEKFIDTLNLLNVAANLQRFFVIRPPEAPGLYFCGGELAYGSASISVGGMGLSFADALRRCLGEAAEFLAQVHDAESPAIQAIPLHQIQPAWPDYWLNFINDPAAKTLDCIEARQLADGTAVFIPADLCIRRPDRQLTVPFKLSSGCAAGITPDKALAKSIAEVIERDAVALWWYGGTPARRFSPEQLEALGISSLLDACRGPYQGRQSNFLAILPACGVSSVFAYSFDKSGKHFACGMATHWDTRKALASALLELCQMELGLALVHLKIEQQGIDSLNEGDKQQLQRSTIKPDCNAFLADPVTSINQPEIKPNRLAGELTNQLSNANLSAYYVDMSKLSLAVPAAKVIIPDLQAATPITLTNRLEAAIKKYGGGWGMLNEIGIY
ncbi:MAG: YcaO-like family protein [Gammaproteobacteria bacterium]